MQVNAKYKWDIKFTLSLGAIMMDLMMDDELDIRLKDRAHSFIHSSCNEPTYSNNLSYKE